MERKTKHRILGFFVIVGLIIILLPFFQGNKELTTDATLVKAPPFPDQAVQVNAEQQKVAPPITTEKPVNQQPDDTINTQQAPAANVKAPEITTVPSANGTAPTPNGAPVTTQQPAEQENSTQPATAPTSAKEGNVQANASASDTLNRAGKQYIADAAVKNTETENVAVTKSVSNKKNSSVKLNKKTLQAKHTHRTNMQSADLLKEPIDNNGLEKLKSAVWVIQVGSFKNKANALRTVNHLRENGYHAFIQQMATSQGQNIRVFVGPESKQAVARNVADQLETEMHLRGIVISYKPLTL